MPPGLAGSDQFATIWVSPGVNTGASGIVIAIVLVDVNGIVPSLSWAFNDK